MLVQDENITEKIMQLSKHYNENIATRFLRPAFIDILSDINISHSVSDLTEHSENFLMQGHDIEDLYTQILSMANFVFLVNRDILPNLHNLTDTNTKNATQDKVYRLMAFNNLPFNIRLLSEMLEDLYKAVYEFDKRHSRRRSMVASKFPDLERLDELLR